MKILVIGDLHGQKPRIHFKDFDCIIQVGDVADDSEFRPYLKEIFKLWKESEKRSIGMDDFIIEKIGKKEFNKITKKSLDKGREVLKFLTNFGKPVFFVPGNWDESYGKTRIKNIEKSDYNYLKAFYDFWLGDKINPKLIKGVKNLKNCQFKNHIFEGVNFVGYGLSSGPEDIKRRKAKLYKKTKRKKDILDKQYVKLKEAHQKIIDKLNLAFKKRNKELPTIFISHNVPYNTKLDVVNDKENYVHKMHLGSSIARKFCEKHEPLLCIGGHLHDHFGKTKIGKTTVINAGFGKDANVLIDLDEKKGKIRKVEFYKKKQ